MKIDSIEGRKSRERYLLDRFISVAKLEARIIEERESPDFVIQTGETRIGVEVTELFISHEKHGSTLQAQEAMTSQVAAKAQQLYQAENGPPAHVTICFSPQKNLRGLNRDVTAKMLCDFVLGLNLSVWQRHDWHAEEASGFLPDAISFVHALGVPSFEIAHWGVARAGWVAPLSPAPLQERIDAKANRLSEYQRAIAENWLLIVADATRPSSLIEVAANFETQATLSPFDRTFFYSHPDKYIELGIRPMLRSKEML